MNSPDFLFRQPFIDLLKSIITNQRDNSSGYSFAIDGEWGCGKTWILKELESQLISENKEYLIFYYNAWENDFYEEPLVALLSVMIEKLNQITSQKSLYGAVVEELLKQVSEDLLTLVSGIVKEVTKIDVEEIIKRKKGFLKKIKDNTKFHVKDIDTLIPLKHTLQEIRKNLKQLSEKFHIILIVDELDRCLPEYAIKVLERLHHVCNEMPIIQVIAINKRHLSDSITTVFGKDYSKTDKPNAWNNFFSESYLQKFIDVIIPVSNGKPDNKLDILSGLEKNYEPYVRQNNYGHEFIKVDEDFLLSFISSLMDGVERRLQEKIYRQVELCHKLTLDSGVSLKQEQCTYAILIYEIISCICRYVFHFNETCKLIDDFENFQLAFFYGMATTKYPLLMENVKINENLKNFFTDPIHYLNQSESSKYLKIGDTKTYIMAFFYEQRTRFDPLQNVIWQWIAEDKVFLDKYDEIMNILTLCN